MGNSEQNQTIAHGAKVFDEMQEHLKYMRKLETVQGYMRHEICDNGYCGMWTVKKLPEEVLLEIMERGRTDEIIYMISRYGQAAPPEKFWEGCAGCGRFAYPMKDHILPEKIQVLIAKRGNPLEIETYLGYNGFCEDAQDIILQRKNHEEIMAYVLRHGLGLKQQRFLLSRGDQDEIYTHIFKHGLHLEILKDMFDSMRRCGDLTFFYDFIIRHELPVEAQKMMLKNVGLQEFQIYVSKYGLWTDVHEDLLKTRSDEEICFYLKRHGYLSREAEHYLANYGSLDVKLFYVRYRYEKPGDDLSNFVRELLNIEPLDYETLSACFLKPTFQTKPMYRSDFEGVVLHMAHATHEEMMEFITQNKGRCMDLTVLPVIFFRNNKEEFEAFVNKFVYR